MKISFCMVVSIFIVFFLSIVVPLILNDIIDIIDGVLSILIFVVLLKKKSFI